MGYYENDVYLYQGLPDDLDELKSYKAIGEIINPSLDDQQGVDLLRALFAQRFSLFYATGLGKTYVASAYMKAINNANMDSKFIMFIKKNQNKQTPAKIKSISGLKSIVFDASAGRLPRPDHLDKYDIIMMTHDTLNSAPHMKAIQFLLPRIKGVIADEIHLLSNIEEASSAFMLYAISSRVEYFLGLTATPITSDLEQLARIFKIVNPFYEFNHRKLGSALKRGGLNELPKQMLDMFSVRDRSQNLRNGILDVIPAMPHQVGAKGKDLFVVTKGEGAFSQANRLVQLIKERKDMKGLVYCNRKEVYRFIVPYLSECGIKVAKINGDTSEQDRDYILEEFRKGNLDVVVTNIKEALDMDSNFVIFYEYTVHVKQMIGRAERGLNPKPVDVIFMVTKDTDEMDYFYRNVYSISQEVEELLDIDFSEVTNTTLNLVK